MKLIETKFEDVKLLELAAYGDDRGVFFEGYSARRYADIGLSTPFVQDNFSVSKKNVLRGLHFQSPNAQGKLITVLSGAVFDVVVDLRKSSKSFGDWFGVELSAQNRLQMYIPPGFAHGFISLTDSTLFCYKCTEFYDPKSERSLLWCDEEVGIKWPVREPIVSKKDLEGLRLSEFHEDVLFD